MYIQGGAEAGRLTCQLQGRLKRQHVQCCTRPMMVCVPGAGPPLANAETRCPPPDTSRARDLPVYDARLRWVLLREGKQHEATPSCHAAMLRKWHLLHARAPCLDTASAPWHERQVPEVLAACKLARRATCRAIHTLCRQPATRQCTHVSMQPRLL